MWYDYSCLVLFIDEDTNNPVYCVTKFAYCDFHIQRPLKQYTLV